MNITIILFDNFETLDVFGPVEIFGRLPEHFSIAYYSLDGGIKTSTQRVKINTRKLTKKTEYTDILLIPGGKGTRTQVSNSLLTDALIKLAAEARYVLTVCTGSALLATTQLLDGKIATSNKQAFEWVQSVRPQVKWKRKARWTREGKYYTSSGISAGMDMALGFIRDILNAETADRIACEMEYNWNSDIQNDPFA